MSKLLERLRNHLNKRDSAGFTQSFMANWLNVGRWRIIEFESKKKIDLELLFSYSEKLSIDIFINHKIN
jgi:DNA-binding XRE family transcriptional regulator